jgi:hypothetical protein
VRSSLHSTFNIKRKGGRRLDPLGEGGDAGGERCVGAEAKKPFRQRAVGPSLGDVAGLVGLAVDVRGGAETFFDGLDHLVEGDGLAVAEIDHLVGAGVIIDGGADALHDVRDVGVVTAGAAIAEDGDGFAVEDHAGELVDGEVRPLARAIHGEEAQADEADAVEVAVHVAEQLAADLGAGVGADGPQHVVVLAPRHPRVLAIDAGGAGEDELRGLPFAGELQQVLGAADVDFLVGDRVGDRRPHAGLGGEVDDHVIAAGERPAHPVEVADVEAVEAVVRLREVGGHVCLLDRRIVEGIEVIHDIDVMAFSKKEIDEMGADEAGAAGD